MKKIDKLMITRELQTLRDMLRWGVSEFNAAGIYYGHGTDNAWDEALYLILSALHLPPDANQAILDARLLKKEREKVTDLVAKRITKRIPAPYLIHQAWFAGFPFYVDERVVIPRSPIAELIEKGFEPWLQNLQPRILDLCTGSGCIGVACGVLLPEAQIDAVDIAKSALEVARINVEHHQVEDRVRLINSDLFNGLSGQIYDLIVSNPPYVGAEEYAGLPHEYHHEPRRGLETGEEGLEIVIRILREAGKHLSPDGILIVEVGNSQQALVERYPHVPFTWLEFERGGDGVFLLTAEQLEKYKEVFSF